MSDISSAIRSLFDSVQSCAIASMNGRDLPEASTTPYIIVEDKLYIFVSELASHTQNLRAHPSCSLLLAEDESQTKNIFARRRIVLHGVCAFIKRDADRFDFLIDIFEEQRGKTVALLKGLNDFHLIEITITSGSYVEGFGAAYRFEGMNVDQAEQETGK